MAVRVDQAARPGKGSGPSDGTVFDTEAFTSSKA
jgi:hypothetical protein